MSEMIYWKDLKPFERNALIAEKVLQRKIYKVNTWGQWLLYHETESGRTEAIPRYSEHLEDAWLIMDYIKPGRAGREERDTREDAFLVRARFASYLDTTGGWWSLTKEQFIEMICLYALKANGYEVIM